MEIVTKTKDWKKAGDLCYETPEGFLLEKKQLSDVCKFYGIPGTLLNVDKKFGTDTFAEVTKVHAPIVKVMVADENVQVLDPKSALVPDEKFEEIISIASAVSGLEPKVRKNKAVFELPALDNDAFLGDLYSRSLSIERLPQGGVNMATALLRLICTNGMVVPDSQYKSLIRSGNVDKMILSAFWDAVDNFNVDQYFRQLFIHGGQPISASVADYFGMHDTLARITEDVDIANLLFPKDPIIEFYGNQKISLDRMSRSTLNRLPSGIEYYQCFCILTHGAKQAEKTLENEIQVSNWCRPSLLAQIKASDLSFKGIPHFEQSNIRSRMGDAY